MTAVLDKACLHRLHQRDQDWLHPHRRGGRRNRGIVTDRHDPYSVDLADCFRRVIERVAPDAELIDHADSLVDSSLVDHGEMPSPSEEALAETIVRGACALASLDAWRVDRFGDRFESGHEILAEMATHRHPSDGAAAPAAATT